MCLTVPKNDEFKKFLIVCDLLAVLPEYCFVLERKQKNDNFLRYLIGQKNLGRPVLVNLRCLTSGINYNGTSCLFNFFLIFELRYLSVIWDEKTVDSSVN